MLTRRLSEIVFVVVAVVSSPWRRDSRRPWNLVCNAVVTVVIRDAEDHVEGPKALRRRLQNPHDALAAQQPEAHRVGLGASELDRASLRSSSRSSKSRPDPFWSAFEEIEYASTIADDGVKHKKESMETDEGLQSAAYARLSQGHLDDAFWWMWMSSLAPEETPQRKSVFGRCAVFETTSPDERWLVVEEAPGPEPGAYIAKKPKLFRWIKTSQSLYRSVDATSQV